MFHSPPAYVVSWVIREMQWWEIWNSGPGEILKNWIYSNLHNTCRKPTPTPWIVNEKKFWPVPSHPWHVCSYFWPFFGVIWSIFPVKNRFSHIFPAPGGSPFLTVNLTVKLASESLTVRFTFPEVRSWKGTESSLVLHLNLFTWRVLSDQQIPYQALNNKTPNRNQENYRDDLKQIQNFHFHSTCWLLFSLGCQLTVCGFWPELLLTEVTAEW